MFQKAEKKKSYLRLALVGPSGSGKTYTALEIATGLAEKTGSRIAVIDTEHGSAQLYADTFDFDFAEIEAPYSVKEYVKIIKAAEKEGIQVLIIDSSSHGWQNILEYVETLTQTKYKGNSFRAWSEGTPLYNEWIESMLSFKGHIIVTMRAKTEYAMETVNGKTTPQKVGMGAENRKGIEYEFTMLMEGTVDHYFTVTKDRTSKFQDRIIKFPSRELGYELYDWLNQGNGFIETKPYIPPQPQPQTPPQHQNTNQNKGADMKTDKFNVTAQMINEGLKEGWVHPNEEEALRNQLNTSKNTNNLAELEKFNTFLQSRKKNFYTKKTGQAPSPAKKTKYTVPELHDKINQGIKVIKDYAPYNEPETLEYFLINKLGTDEINKCTNIQLLEDCYTHLVEEYKRVKPSA